MYFYIYIYIYIFRIPTPPPRGPWRGGFRGLHNGVSLLTPQSLWCKDPRGPHKGVCLLTARVIGVRAPGPHINVYICYPLVVPRAPHSCISLFLFSVSLSLSLTFSLSLAPLFLSPSVSPSLSLPLSLLSPSISFRNLMPLPFAPSLSLPLFLYPSLSPSLSLTTSLSLSRSLALSLFPSLSSAVALPLLLLSLSHCLTSCLLFSVQGFEIISTPRRSFFSVTPLCLSQSIFLSPFQPLTLSQCLSLTIPSLSYLPLAHDLSLFGVSLFLFIPGSFFLSLSLSLFISRSPFLTFSCSLYLCPSTSLSLFYSVLFLFVSTYPSPSLFLSLSLSLSLSLLVPQTCFPVFYFFLLDWSSGRGVAPWSNTIGLAGLLFEISWPATPRDNSVTRLNAAHRQGAPPSNFKLLIMDVTKPYKFTGFRAMYYKPQSMQIAEQLFACYRFAFGASP